MITVNIEIEEHAPSGVVAYHKEAKASPHGATSLERAMEHAINCALAALGEVMLEATGKGEMLSGKDIIPLAKKRMKARIEQIMAENR